MKNKANSNLIKNNYNVYDANKSFFYVMTSNIIAPVLFVLLTSFIALFLDGSVYDGAVGILQSILIPLLFITFILLHHKKHSICITKATGFSWKINPLILLLIVVILVLCIIGFFPFINMLYEVIAKTGINTTASVGFEMTNWWRLLIGVVIYCALPAIVEEIIFRGMLLNGTLNKAKPYVAIVLSAMAFFVMHGSLIQSFYQIALGFILSFIGYYTKNIIYPIIFHFLNNLAVVLISYFNIGGFLNGFSLSVGGFFVGVGLMLGCALGIVTIIFLIKLIMTKNKSNDYELIVDGNNIIIEDNRQKYGFKNFLNSFNSDERFYFYFSWISAVVIWIFNSFGG